MKVILLLTMCLSLFACGNKNTKGNKAQEQQPQKDHVEVLYFHGKQRCITCAAIEKNTKETVETLFADELKDGSLVFKSIDISQSENEEIINKYEVTWSSLFITKWKNGKDSTKNLTEYAFAKALSAPDTFKANVTQKIRQLLK